MIDPKSRYLGTIDLQYYSGDVLKAPLNSSRTRGQLTSRPMYRTGAKYKLHRATTCEYVLPSYPSLVPSLSINFQALNVGTGVSVSTVCGDLKRLAVPKANGHMLEPGGKNEEGRLAGQGVETNHLPLWQLSVSFQRN